MRLSEIMMLKATVLPSWIRQRMKERKEVTRTALKGTFWWWWTYGRRPISRKQRWEGGQTYFGDPTVAWRASVSCERPDFPGSSGQGCNVGCSDKEGEDDCEGNVDARGSSVCK